MSPSNYIRAAAMHSRLKVILDGKAVAKELNAIPVRQAAAYGTGEYAGRAAQAREPRQACTGSHGAEVTVVSAALSDAKRNEIIQKNPARMIDLPSTERREQFIPSEQQAEQLITALLEEEWLYKA